MRTPRSLSRRSFLRVGLGGGLGGGLALAGATLLAPRRGRAAVADIDFGSALGAARAIRSGQVSSLELTNRMLDRSARHNPRLNAIVQLDPDGALARARAADEARARGEWWGPFHGVPCTVKDTFEAIGLRTTAGSPTLKDYVSPRDAAVVARLKRAGVVILGKTNVPIWASDMQSYNAVYGQTNNPWDLTRTPGGSTGGGAAALAAGLTFLEPGSDIGGSIRTPAHFCGVYGHKPTLDVVPLRGHVPPPPGVRSSPPTSLSVAGPLARSAADLRAALEVMGGPLEDEGRAWRWALPPARAARLADYRIGYVLDDPLCPVSPEVGDALRVAVEALRKAGATLEEGWPQGMKPEEQYDAYLTLLFATLAGPQRDDQLEDLRKIAAANDGSYRAKRARAITGPHGFYQQADRRGRAARGLWQSYFRTHDAFLLPTDFVPAFPHDHSPNFFERILQTPGGPRPYLDLLFWISFATLAGLPATTAPVGLTRGGLPVGIQIMGPYLEDATTIDLAGRLADLLGGFRPPPGF